MAENLVKSLLLPVCGWDHENGAIGHLLEPLLLICYGSLDPVLAAA